MSKATACNSTPPVTLSTVTGAPRISENPEALRLLLAAVRLRRHGENWHILTGTQVVRERGADNKTITLEQIKAICRRLGI
jgi:hypothetical protein